jgi:hypothetical protein
MTTEQYKQGEAPIDTQMKNGKIEVDLGTLYVLDVD